MSMVKTRDEVGPADDVVGVEEAEGTIFEARDKLDSIQPFGFPAGSVRFIDLEPADPKDVHFSLIHHCWSMKNIKPEDTKNSRIGIWVNCIIGECHDV